MVNITSLEKEIGGFLGEHAKEIGGALGAGFLVHAPISIGYYVVMHYLWKKYCQDRKLLNIKISEVEDRLAKLDSGRKRKIEGRDKLIKVKNRVDEELKGIIDEMKKKSKLQDIRQREEDIRGVEKDINDILVEYDFLVHVERLLEKKEKLKEKGFWEKIIKQPTEKFEKKLREMTDKGILKDERRKEYKEILEREEKVWGEI